jgi:hypothetical protein
LYDPWLTDDYWSDIDGDENGDGVHRVVDVAVVAGVRGVGVGAG